MSSAERVARARSDRRRCSNRSSAGCGSSPVASLRCRADVVVTRRITSGAKPSRAKKRFASRPWAGTAQAIWSAPRRSAYVAAALSRERAANQHDVSDRLALVRSEVGTHVVAGKSRGDPFLGNGTCRRACTELEEGGGQKDREFRFELRSHPADGELGSGHNLLHRWNGNGSGPPTEGHSPVKEE